MLKELKGRLNENGDKMTLYAQQYAKKTVGKALNELNTPQMSIKLPTSLIADASNISVSTHAETFNGVYHSHDFFELVYVYEGSVTDSIDGNVLRLKKGNVCMTNPNAIHALSDFDKNEDTVVNILLSKELFGKAFYSFLMTNSAIDSFFNRYTGENVPTYVSVCTNAAETEPLIDEIVREFFDPDGQFVLETAIMLLLARIMKKAANAPNDDFATKLKTYMSNKLSTVTLVSAAEQFGFHPKYFSSLVKKKLGRSFQSILVEMRLNKAAALLEYTDLPIERIAELVGYDDATSLYGNFKLHFGASPGEFRVLNKY